MSAELVSTTNSLNQYGTITTFRTPLALTMHPEVIGAGILGPATYTITGAWAIPPEAATVGSYMGFVKDGCYVVSMNRLGGTGVFPYTELLDNMADNETVVSSLLPTSGGVDQLPWKGAPIFWDNNYDSIVMKIAVPEGVPASQTFILKNWLTVEMRTVQGSWINGFAQPAPPNDPRAFKLYGAIQTHLPVAVPAKDNPDFWNTVLSIIKPISGVASMLKGPIGTAAKGVHAISEALSPDSDKREFRANVGKYKFKLVNKNKPKKKKKDKNKKPRTVVGQRRLLPPR